MEISPKHAFVNVGGKEIHVRIWGHSGAPQTVFAVHGMSRNGSDFDAIASKLSAKGRYRVICPDLPGRGMSQWARFPAVEYRMEALAFLASGLLAALGVHRCLWLGASLGGVIGMAVAAGPFGGVIQRLVMNDVGPEVEEDALQRIREYVPIARSFATLLEAETCFRDLYASFGPLSDDEWRSFAANSVRRRTDGSWTTSHDPRIEAIFDNPPSPDAVWEMFLSVRCPVLTLRGAESELLSEQIAVRMTERHSNCRLVTIDGCGHAPFLNTPDQIRTVKRFFREAEV